MGFSDAVGSCFSNYATFTGRASRSEYWYFVLFQALANLIVGIIAARAGSNLLGGLVELALFLPALAVGVRRLHDIDKSGWWLLACTKGTLGVNRFGPDPLPAAFMPA